MAEDSHLVCRHFTISGIVQGVFFRSATQKQAKTLPLTGWVRNCRNGDVEVIACGPIAAVDQLDHWLQHGPELAEVTAVTTRTLPFETFDAFTIERDD